MVTLKNEFLKVEISEIGCEIKSIIYNNRQYAWVGDEKYWAKSGPMLFPICSSLRDDTYTYNGKAYNLLMHGFAKVSEFKVETKTEDTLTLLLTDSEETLKVYPFNFELRANYKLNGKKIEISYTVKNTTDGEMYYSIGSHEGYSCPNGVEEYDIILPEAEDINHTFLDGRILSYNKTTLSENNTVFALKNSYFSEDAIIITDLKARELSLKNRVDNTGVKVNFEGHDYLLIWTKPNAPYLCIEPWCGICDRPDSDGDITHKEGINKLLKGEERIHKHSIEIF